MKTRIDSDQPVGRKRDALKAKNLDAFRKRMPDVHRLLIAHRPASQLVFDDAGAPDAVAEGRPVYAGHAAEQAAWEVEAFLRNPNRFCIQDSQPGDYDEHANVFLDSVLRRALEDGITFADAHVSPQSYFLIVFGVGLGAHIEPLVEATGCRYLLFVEPDMDFLHHSLSVFDWENLMDRLETSGGSVNFLIDPNPENLAATLRFALRATNPCSVDGLTYYLHRQQPYAQETVAALRRDETMILTGLGLFYDELLMLKNAHATLGSGEARIYSQTDGELLDVPAFVVASGPSLDANLDIIRDNAERAIIIASGSAIRPLMRNGIVPDFQIETENIDVVYVTRQVADEFDISGVPLVAAVTVDRSILSYFEDIVYFFRAPLSPFNLFCDSDRYCLANPDPTVANASLSLAQGLRFRDVYMFGVDMGARPGGGHHSEHTWHYTEAGLAEAEAFDIELDDVHDIPVPANFGGQCLASRGLLVARLCLVEAIRAFADGRRYFNCSDGARIDGAEPLRAGDLSLPEIEGGKRAIVDEIMTGFPVFAHSAFEEAWNDDSVVAAVNRLADGLLEDFARASDFRDKAYLSRLMRRLKPGIAGAALGTNSVDAAVLVLFRGTIFMMLIALEYHLNRIPDLGAAARFEAIAREELIRGIETMRGVATDILGDPSAGMPPWLSGPSDPVPIVVEPLAKPNDSEAPRISRNTPCPCMSGRRYKDCHGRVG